MACPIPLGAELAKLTRDTQAGLADALLFPMFPVVRSTLRPVSSDPSTERGPAAPGESAVPREVEALLKGRPTCDKLNEHRRTGCTEN